MTTMYLRHECLPCPLATWNHSRIGLLQLGPLVLWMLVSITSVGGQERFEGSEQHKALIAEIQKTKARDLSSAFRVASSHILPSVVTILGSTKEVNETLEQLELLDDGERFDIVGSGVILDSSGMIVTNHHVVSDAKYIVVRLENGREYVGSEVRSDPSSDLAILKISSPDPLPASTLGDSDSLAVGDWVLAIGSPFNLELTVSAGILSGRGRVLRGLPQTLSGQFLQTDAVINPGNSGGALVNLDGELIGINTAIASRNGVFSGVGFAIPSSRVKWITSELSNRGKVRRARIGVRSNQIPQIIADELKLPVRGGVYITLVAAGLPAAEAGVEVGDVVVEVAGQRVRTPNEFSEYVEQLSVGEPHLFKIVRAGESLELTIKPIEREEQRRPGQSRPRPSNEKSPRDEKEKGASDKPADEKAPPEKKSEEKQVDEKRPEEKQIESKPEAPSTSDPNNSKSDSNPPTEKPAPPSPEKS